MKKWLYAKTFFFFQAEDGIRDGHVTGVQTCALPISTIQRAWAEGYVRVNHEIANRVAVEAERSRKPALVFVRSEERRVGKEWRSGGCEDDEQGKDGEIELHFIKHDQTCVRATKDEYV